MARSARSLVIVESPAKAKTINHYLGPGYLVKASMGHVRDLPKSKLGVDVEHDFEPTYQVIPEKKKVVAELKKLAKESASVILAADPDREGEAIAWHLSRLIGEENPKNLPGGLSRDHRGRGQEGVRAPRRAGPAQDRGPADAADPGPARRLPHQPAALEEDRPRPERGPGPVRHLAAHLRAREGDPGLRSRGILEHHGPARGLQPAGVQGRPGQDRRQEGQGREQGTGRRDPGGLPPGAVRPGKDQGRGEEEEPGPALHHEHPPAGRVPPPPFPGQEDDVRRPETL